MGPANSPEGTSWSNTLDTIRVGRQHTFSRAPALLTPYVCTVLRADVYATVLTLAAHSWPRGLDFKRCLDAATRMTLRRAPLLQPLAALVDLVLGLVHTFL